jgi:hypothetical protein
MTKKVIILLAEESTRLTCYCLRVRTPRSRYRPTFSTLKCEPWLLINRFHTEKYATLKKIVYRMLASMNLRLTGEKSHLTCERSRELIVRTPLAVSHQQFLVKVHVTLLLLLLPRFFFGSGSGLRQMLVFSTAGEMLLDKPILRLREKHNDIDVLLLIACTVHMLLLLLLSDTFQLRFTMKMTTLFGVKGSSHYFGSSPLSQVSRASLLVSFFFLMTLMPSCTDSIQFITYTKDGRVFTVFFA